MVRNVQFQTTRVKHCKCAYYSLNVKYIWWIAWITHNICMVTSQHDNAFRITIPLSFETTILNGSTHKGQVIRSFEIDFGVRLSKLGSQQLSWGLVLRRRISMRYFPIRKSKDYVYDIWVSMSYLFVSISFNDTFISNTKFIWQWMDLINVSYFHYWSRVLWVSITKYQPNTGNQAGSCYNSICLLESNKSTWSWRPCPLNSLF